MIAAVYVRHRVGQKARPSALLCLLDIGRTNLFFPMHNKFLLLLLPICMTFDALLQASFGHVTSAKEVMFSLRLVCLFVSKITQKLLNRLKKIGGKV